MKRIFVVISSLMFIMCLVGCNPNKISSINRIKEVTSLNFPTDAEIIFNIEDNVFIHGRLAQYSVIKLNDDSKEFLSTNYFNNKLPKNFKENFYSQIDKCYTIKREDIKSNYFPNFEEDNFYLYLENDDVYLIYDNYNEYLIVFITAQ